MAAALGTFDEETYVYFPAVAPPLATASFGEITDEKPRKLRVDTQEEFKNRRLEPSSLSASSVGD